MRWNAYSRWRFVFDGAVVFLGGHGPHLPPLDASVLRRSDCIQLQFSGLLYAASGPANDLSAWWGPR